MLSITHCPKSSGHPTRPGQHGPVHRSSLLGPTQIRTGTKPEHRRVRRQHMGAPQLLGRPLKQRPVRQEIAASQQDLDQCPIALTAGVTTRPDRTKLAFIGDPDQVQVVQHRAPQHHPTHPSHRVIAHLDVHRSRPSAGPVDQFAGIKQRACSVHLTGAPVSGRIGRFVLPILPANRGTCRAQPPTIRYPAAISGSELQAGLRMRRHNDPHVAPMVAVSCAG